MWISNGLKTGCASIETETTQRNNQRNGKTEKMKKQVSPFS
jgi:hypothetical protein